MSKQDNGGPAFPVLPPCDMEGASASGYPYPSEGMTLRDYFAAKALPAAIKYWREDSESDHFGKRDPDFDFSSEDDGGDMNLIAMTAYEMADAMLKARQE